MLIKLITVQALMVPNKVISIMTSNMTSLRTNYIRTVSSKFVRYNLKVIDLTSILLIVAQITGTPLLLKTPYLRLTSGSTLGSWR